jgi:hypothetical protein
MSNPAPNPGGGRRKGLTIGVVVALVVAVALALWGTDEADGAVRGAPASLTTPA